MQNLQSQLGKSLSLQLLMTAPRRNFASDGPTWLQSRPLDSLQLLLGYHVRLPCKQNPTEIQKHWPAFRDAAMVWLAEHSVSARV